MSEVRGRYVLTLSCPDVTGVVHAVSGFLAGVGCNIVDSAQFGDSITKTFFMRVSFDVVEGVQDIDSLTGGFRPVGNRFGMNWAIHDSTEKPRVLLMVSRFGHCLNDLLYRHSIGALAMDIPAIVSNHRDYERLSGSYDIPFHHLPVTRETKLEQEEKLLALVDAEHIDLVVLARYMQVLSEKVCDRMEGRVINIHHSFLPSFKGAKPYSQAHRRGVKLIGATAHYVTSDLDEGPIIEQEVSRVDHSMTPADLTAVGRDLECVALARAVQYHTEHRVLLNGDRTVVFR
ncbi:MAG: formyltetrahydrofolate deformylase [Alphaproteobacteria bacterium]|jgi:formyltetrahydrofolate deformylase